MPFALGMTIENILLLVVNVIGLLPYAKDFRIGALISLLMNGVLFMGLEYMEMQSRNALIICLLFLVILCLSLYLSKSASPNTGII